jgi:putative transposase
VHRRGQCGDVVGIFPDPDAIIRLFGVVLGEQHDEWTQQRRYIGLDVLARCQLTISGADSDSRLTTSAAPCSWAGRASPL